VQPTSLKGLGRRHELNHTLAKMHIITRSVELHERKGRKREVFEESATDRIRSIACRSTENDLQLLTENDVKEALFLKCK